MKIKRSYARAALFVVAVLLVTGSSAQTHFTTVDNTGVTSPVVIQNVLVDGSLLSSGDEIGVFDGSLCVGAVVYQGILPLGFPAYLEFVTPSGDTLYGAESGTQMQFRVWKKSSGSEASGSPSFSLGGSFGDVVTVVETLTASLTGVDPAAGHLPERVELFPAYPNPFNPETVLSFTLPLADNVEFTIYDDRGRKIIVLINGFISAGRHQVIWDGRDEGGVSVPSGTYLALLRTEKIQLTRKLVLVK